MPDTPDGPRALPGGTPARLAPRALLVALPGGQAGAARDRPLAPLLPLGSCRLHDPLDLGTRLGRLPPILPNALEACGHRVLHHPADHRVTIDRVVLHPLGAGRAGMLRAPLARITLEAADGERRTHHVCGHGARSTLGRCRDVAPVHVGHQAMGILLATLLHQRVALCGLEGLAYPAPQVPLPLPAAARLGQGMARLPTLPLAITPPPRGADRQRRRIVARAPMRVEHRQRAALQRFAPALALEGIQARHAAAPSCAP